MTSSAVKQDNRQPFKNILQAPLKPLKNPRTPNKIPNINIQSPTTQSVKKRTAETSPSQLQIETENQREEFSISMPSSDLESHEIPADTVELN